MPKNTRSSAARTIGLVVCPDCQGVAKPCALCADGRRVPVDVAVHWNLSHAPRPAATDSSGTVSRPPPDALVLEAIDQVLAALAGAEETPEVKALVERARGLQTLVAGWSRVGPARADREAINRKVLGLHIAARQVRSKK